MNILESLHNYFLEWLKPICGEVEVRTTVKGRQISIWIGKRDNELEFRVWEFVGRVSLRDIDKHGFDPYVEIFEAAGRRLTDRFEKARAEQGEKNEN